MRKTASTITENLNAIYEHVRGAISESKGKQNVKLIAVSKRQPDWKIEEAISSGHKDFGENYVEATVERIRKFPSVNWHLIGPVQSKKVKLLDSQISLFHSVDRLKIAKLLNEKLSENSKKQSVLLQVNIANEKSKSGFSAENLEMEMPKLLELRNLQIAGLMIMPPFTSDPESSRPYFAKARELLSSLKERYHLKGFSQLSMGTTQDYRVAINEGSTLIRVGTAIFGEREE